MGGRAPCNMASQLFALTLATAALALSAAAPVPAQDSGMWSVDFQVRVTHRTTFNVTTTHRTTDPGWGVDLKFKGNRGIHADIWDTDGDAFFKIAVGDAYCSIEVGSDGEEPGAVVSVFESHGLACSFKQEKGKGTHYNVVINAELSHAHDCSGTPTQPGKGPKCPSETRLAPDAETMIITSETAAKCPIQPGSLCMFDAQCNQTAGCESWKCNVPGSEGRHFCGPPKAFDTSTRSCCACVKGSDMGSDLWSFEGTDCNACCMKKGGYSSGKSEPADVCVSHSP